jgi:hypothetical protein
MTRFDPIRILETLNEYEVRYLVVGGVAAAAHGSPSVTGDLDICYDRRADNLDRLAAALVALHAKRRDVDPSLPSILDAKTLKFGDSFTFTTSAGDFDCLGTPAGTSGYDDLISGAVETDLDGFTIRVTSLDDLIRMKRAAGRPKDRVELEILGALRDEIENG